MAENVIKFGRRVPKSKEYSQGWQDISTNEINTGKPIVICLGGSGAVLSSQANGIAKLAEKSLGMQDLDFNERACDIYSVYYPTVVDTQEEILYFEALNNGEKPDISQYSEKTQQGIKAVTEFSNNIINDVLVKLITDENGNKLSVEDAAKSIRNVNFLTFCYGSVVQLAINIMFRDKLIQMGYNEQEAQIIESQISIFQTSPYCEASNTNQTTTSFVSLNDAEMSNSPLVQFAKHSIDEKPVGDVIPHKENHNIVYVNALTTFGGPDEHRSEFYLAPDVKDWSKAGANESEVVGDVLPVALAVCLRKAVNNSFINKNAKHITKYDKSKYIPISSADYTQPCKKIMNMANSEKSSRKVAGPLNQYMSKKFIPGLSRKAKTKDEK